MDRFVPQNQYIHLHLLSAFSAFYKMEGFIIGNPTPYLAAPTPPVSVSIGRDENGRWWEKSI
jgi:hypothetical protein